MPRYFTSWSGSGSSSSSPARLTVHPYPGFRGAGVVHQGRQDAHGNVGTVGVVRCPQGGQMAAQKAELQRGYMVSAEGECVFR